MTVPTAPETRTLTTLKQVAKETLTIRPAVTEADVASYAKLSLQYTSWLTSLGVDLGFQSLQQEMDSLPGDYAQPDGVILIASLATATGKRQDVGAVALRPFAPHHVYGSLKAATDWTVRSCEMKRLYVLPNWQCYGIGKQLAEAAVDAARDKDYHRLILDTLDRLTSANKLYKRLGFQHCPSYNGNPLPDVNFWELVL